MVMGSVSVVEELAKGACDGMSGDTAAIDAMVTAAMNQTKTLTFWRQSENNST